MADYIDLMNQNTAKTFQFNHNEAQLSRDWQERMSNTSHQRQVADLQAAGLNPVLSANSGATGYTASTASGTADSSGISAMAQVASSLISADATKYAADVGSNNSITGFLNNWLESLGMSSSDPGTIWQKVANGLEAGLGIKTASIKNLFNKSHSAKSQSGLHSMAVNEIRKNRKESKLSTKSKFMAQVEKDRPLARSISGSNPYADHFMSKYHTYPGNVPSKNPTREAQKAANKVMRAAQRMGSAKHASRYNK